MVERAIFLTVLHRLFISGSDRFCDQWRRDYYIEGTEKLSLHHLYRAMAFLGEKLEDQKMRTPFSPRCIKDLIEEGLFHANRNLFTGVDLVDIPTTLPLLFSMLREGGLFYFTINFDSVTIMEPVIDPHLDELIVSLYHQTMDERIVNGKISGDSRAGRRLFTYLKDAGAQILDAGGSDWVVFSCPAGYPKDEAYFLHFIIHTIHGALERHPQMDAARLAVWAARRHAQVESGELVCIIHQLDFVGRVSARGR